MVLIVPCAGRSTRFGLDKPKFLLTHPDGKLMIEKALEGINLDQFDRIIFTIVDDQITTYDTEPILRQVFENFNIKVEICILTDYTSSQSQTVYETLRINNVNGSFAVKDSDNKILLSDNLEENMNYVLGLDIQKIGQEINRLQSKSFLKVNNQGYITNIIEKKIISDVVCIGFYVFRDSEMFKLAYQELSDSFEGELYLSHIISHQILTKNEIFSYKNSSIFEDYGTLEDWKLIQSKFKTYFVDYDGVLVRNKGKYGIENWETIDEPIKENLLALRRICNNGSQIIITTSRPKKFENKIASLLKSYDINIHSIVSGLSHSQRILINDHAGTNPYPSAVGISINRNSLLDEYLE